MKIEVTGFPRKLQGTGASRRLRASGRVPGVVYGANKPAQPIELDQHALLRHLRMEAFHASILDMAVDGTRERVLLRDFQMHPWKPMVLHIDFQRIDPTEKIHMKVPLHFKNGEISPGVKLGGGVVQHITNEIDVQCLPDDLPEYIEVDLKDLQLGALIHVNDIVMPKGVEPTSKVKHDNPTVATVQVPREVAVEEEAAAPVTEITGQGAAEAEAPAAAPAPGEKKEADKKEPEKKEAAK
jgi:large subunit ribosomal protein L25